MRDAWTYDMQDMAQGLLDDWRVRLAFPIFRLIDFLLSRQRIARFLFDNFRTKDNLKKVLQVRAFGKSNHYCTVVNRVLCAVASSAALRRYCGKDYST